MNKVIKESKKVMELQPKINEVFNEIDGYATGYKQMEKENQKYKKEINKLECDNEQLQDKNNRLIRRIEAILEGIKKFFRKLLQLGNEKTKEAVTEEVKDYYDYEDFTMEDVVKISRGTTKQDELFDYVEAPHYLKERVRDYDEYEHEKDDFDMSR